jgi:hypothetical protein
LQDLLLPVSVCSTNDSILLYLQLHAFVEYETVEAAEKAVCHLDCYLVVLLRLSSIQKNTLFFHI